MSGVLKTRIEVVNELGLHTRAATQVVRAASRFASEITISHGPMRANAKSIMGLLALGARRGVMLDLEVEGEDQQAAFEEIVSLARRGFGEGGTPS